jgi:antitoxin (DNA-binding transcriptional repressor) of toxin-antitoxin stability system
MTTITIADIQSDPTGYLRRVQAGEVFIITDRDQPIAEIKPADRTLGNGPRIGPADFLKGRVDDARIPLRWRDEGIAEPTEDCRRSCLELTQQLFDKHGMLPSKVVASRQEGIYLEYKSPRGGRTLGIEVDNELDIVAVVSDANQTLSSAAFEGDGAEELLHSFFDGLAASPGGSRTINT